MISIHARDGAPDSPVLIYDGGNHALLYRTPQSSVLLDYIHPEIREQLFKSNQVLIAETKDYKVIREYIVTCRSVKSLPIDGTGIKPLLDKEEASSIDDRDLYK